MSKKKEYKKEGSLKIVVRSHDVTSLEECLKALIQELSRIKVEFSSPIPLPVRRTLMSLLTSPNRYNTSQEQFIEEKHRRIIYVYQPSSQDLPHLRSSLNTFFNRLKLPSAVDMKWVVMKRTKKI